jgi:hypothetical protein
MGKSWLAFNLLLSACASIKLVTARAICGRQFDILSGELNNTCLAERCQGLLGMYQVDLGFLLVELTFCPFFRFNT